MQSLLRSARTIGSGLVGVGLISEFCLYDGEERTGCMCVNVLDNDVHSQLMLEQEPSFLTNSEEFNPKQLVKGPILRYHLSR